MPRQRAELRRPGKEKAARRRAALPEPKNRCPDAAAPGDAAPAQLVAILMSFTASAWRRLPPVLRLAVNWTWPRPLSV